MRSRVLGAAALLALLPLVGCSSDDEPAPSDPDSSTSSASSTAGSSTSAPTSTPAETGSETPEVTPATGTEITVTDFDTPVARFRLPDDIEWRIQPDQETAYGDLPGGPVEIYGSTQTASPEDVPDDFAAVTLKTRSSSEPKVTQGADRAVAGVDGYVLEGSDSNGFAYIYGTIRGEAAVQLIFTFPADDADARAWIESVLATVEWL